MSDSRSALSSSEQILLDNLINIFIFPHVRYIPAEEASYDGGASERGDWEESDLKDVPLEDHNSRCYLCLEDFQPPYRKSLPHALAVEMPTQDPLVQYPCGHVFHQECANCWAKDHWKCLLCKNLLFPGGQRAGNGWFTLCNVVRDQYGIVGRVVDLEHLQEMTDSNFYSASFSADGQHIAVEGASSTYVFERGSAAVIRTFAHHELRGSCISPNGQLVASGDKSGNIKIWNITATEGAENIGELRGHSKEIRALVFLDGGGALLSLAEDSTLRVWDLATLDTTRTIHMKNGSTTVWACLAQHGSYAAVSLRGVIELWNIETGLLVSWWKAHEADIKSMCFMPDGSGLFSGTKNEPLKYWDMPTVLSRHPTSLESQTGGEAAKSRAEGMAASSAIEPARIFAGSTDLLWSLTVSPDGRWVAACNGDGLARIWDVQTSTLQCALTLDGADLEAVAFSPQGDSLLTCGKKTPIRMWKITAIDVPTFQNTVTVSAPSGCGMLDSLPSVGEVHQQGPANAVQAASALVDDPSGDVPLTTMATAHFSISSPDADGSPGLSDQERIDNSSHARKPSFAARLRAFMASAFSSCLRIPS